MSGDAANKAAGRVLLPDVVLPIRYELRLAPDLERFTFDAKCCIEVEVFEATSEVTLHARELNIKGVVFSPSSDDSSPIEVLTISRNVKENTATFGFDEVLPVGKGRLEIDYVGELNNQMAGFYRSSYTDIHGVSKMMASTQFESIDARRCFPCWDEPGRKAIFGVTIVVDPSLTALSNMPEKESKLVKTNGKVLKEIEFMDSPKMSTYLLAFVVGEFDYVQAKTEHGVLIRVYAPPGRSEDGKFALGIATKCLDLYDDFFGLPFPLPKCDMVAIPEFAAGAMENWGLVTYRECDLMIDKKTASASQQQRVALVVTHELAHQWFGNLVTMAWWDDLWLNEGFASWCENYSGDILTDYKYWDQFPGDTLAAALRLDGLATSHPIQVPIHKAEEVEEVFDAISYCKGASVVRMAYAVLGDEAFKKGLRQYMQRHQYSNTETFDLWNAWSESSGMDVKELMASWTEQMGFPIVEVKSCTVDGDKAKLELAQSWFLSNGKSPPEEKTWNVPLFIGSAGGKMMDLKIMKEKATTIEVPLSSAWSDNFILMNKGVQVPMRVLYTEDMRNKLIQAIRKGEIEPVDRAYVLADAYNLAKAGKIGADEVLKMLVLGYVGEVNFVVWDTLSIVLNGLQKIFMGGGASDEVYALFMTVANRFVAGCWAKANLGWTSRPTDSHLDGLLRGVLMKMVSKFGGDDGWQTEASRRFAKYLEDPQANGTELPDEYRTSVFQAMLQAGGEAEHTQLLGAFKKLTTNVEQKFIFSSIGYASDAKLKEKTMHWAISGEIKRQDFFYILGSVAASSKSGLDMTWSFFQSEFPSLKTFVKDAAPSIMDAVIRFCTAGFCSETMAAEIEKFFEGHPLPQNKRTIANVLEEIRGNASFAQKAVKVCDKPFFDKLLSEAVF